MKRKNPSVTLRRTRIVAAARGESLIDIGRTIEVDPEHLRKALSGQRKLSDALASRLREYLGEAAWAFALGLSDRLEVQSTAEVRCDSAAWTVRK